ncbi:MAG: DUF3418 domain-containing protein, partial [Akkermansia sp.]|nr:DUF3418 domain-containing protein [Akkermansia sp.]
ADDFAEDWYDREPDRPLGQALAEFVMRRTQKFCNAQQFDFSRLPADLITKVWVGDDEGKTLAMGHDMTELRERLQSYQEKRFRKKASRSFSATAMTRWDCGDLPATIDVGNGIGYPALCDDGERVRIKVYPSQEEAQRAHRFGVRRLALIRHGDFINSIRKRLPIKSVEAKLAMTTLGAQPKNNVADTIYAAMDATLAPLPRTAADFDSTCLRMRERLYDTISGSISKVWEQLAATDSLMREYCLTAARDRYAARIADDLKLDWSWLTRSYFLSDGEPATMQDIHRYARGLQMRIQKIAQQPAIRELERIDTFNAAVRSDFYTEFPNRVNSPAWISYALMVAEFRLSIFAPTLAMKGRASAKKLAAAAEQL